MADNYILFTEVKSINLILAMLLCLFLVAYGLSAEDAEGEWSCLDDGNGKLIHENYTLTKG